MALITAFVERWHPETNTFHMPFGEMSITLLDVEQILGVRCSGEPVRPVVVDENVERTMIELLAPGVDLGLLEAIGVDGIDSKSLIMSTMWMVGRNPSSMTPALRASCYLAYLFGSTLCPNKSGNMVPAKVVALFNDLERASNLAWGAATLAFLYDQLGKASRAKAKQLSGCMTLLEVISYI